MWFSNEKKKNSLILYYSVVVLVKLEKSFADASKSKTWYTI